MAKHAKPKLLWRTFTQLVALLLLAPLLVLVQQNQEQAQAAGSVALGAQLCRSTTGNGATLETDVTKNGYYVSAATGRTGDSVTGIRIDPLFGKRMYVDPGRNFDATYIAYRITNNTGSSLDNLTVALDGFSGTVIRPVSSDDTSRYIGTLANGASKTAYFMLRATATSDSNQEHEVRVFQGTVASGTQLAGCNTNIQGVQRSLAASANKVTSISVSGSPALGSTFTITVNGAPGKVGQGNDIDGSVMAISPASQANWPTKAIRLESVQLQVRGFNGNSTSNSCIAAGASTFSSGVATFVDTLIVRAFNTCANTTKQTYTATYTFRVVGFAATNPAIVPLASIGSGTQVKYTGSLPSASTTVPLTSTTNPLTVTKSLVSSTVNGNDVDITYRLTVDSSATASLQELRDLPDSGMTFVSASYTDAAKTNQAISKVDVTVGADTYWSFQAPFSVTAATDLVLTYVARVTKPGTGTQTYSNEGFALYGETVVGSGANVTGIDATVAADGSVTSVSTSRVVDKVPQTITLETPLSMGNNSSVNLYPTSDSGLPVTLTSTTTGVCLISEFNGVWTLTSISEGTCTIVATQGGNDTFAAAPDVTQNITVLKGQVISYTATNFSGTGAGSTASLTVTATSKLSVTVVSIDVEICTLAVATPYNATTGETVFTVTTGSVTGACILQASQSGDATWGPAPVRDITLGVGTAQAIDFSSPADGASFSYSAGLNFDAVATAKTPNASGTVISTNPITYSSSTPAVCTVRQLVVGDSISSGLDTRTGVTTVPIDVVNPGSCVITASQDGLKDDGTSSGYAAATDVTKTFTITGSGTTPQNIVFDAVGGKTYGDQNFVAYATSKKTSDNSNTGLLVTITSTTPTICTVSSSALETDKSKVTVVLLSAGDCILQGAQAGSATYQAATIQTLTITVATKQLTVSGLSASKVYDGTDSLTFSGTAALSGTVPGDDLSAIALSGTASGSYPDVDAGVGKSITVSGLTLSGSKAASYTLASYQVSGTITARPVTISFTAATVAGSANIVCADRVGVTSGSLVRNGSITAVTCNGIPANGDDNDAATLMANGDATVTPSAATITEDVSGVATDTTSNYSITYVAGTLTVSSKIIPTLETADVTVLYGMLQTELESSADTSGTANGKTKAKNGGTEIPGSLSHKKNGAAVTGELDVGTHILTVEFTPNDANTYGTASTTRVVTVTKRQLKVNGLSVSSKVYDGTTSATFAGTPSLAPDVVGHDVLVADQAQVSLSGSASGAFADANVGSGKSVGLSGFSLTGGKSGNYQLVNQNLTGEITKRPITFQAQSKSKFFGAADPSFTYTISAGSFATGENASTIGGVGVARVSGETVGEHSVNISVQPDVPGTPRANYNITTTAAKLYIARPTLQVTEAAGVITDNTVTCSCEGFKPGATVTVTMFSTPTVLDTATVAGDGTCPDLVATIPDGTEGTHNLEIESLFPNDDPLTYSISFTAQANQGGSGGGGGGGGGTPPAPVVIPPAPTPEVTPTPTPTPTVSPTPTPSPSVTPVPTPRPTVTPAPRPRPTQTQAPRPTITPQPTQSASPSPSATQSARPTPTQSATQSARPTPTETQLADPPRALDRVVGEGLNNWFTAPVVPSQAALQAGGQQTQPEAQVPIRDSEVRYDTGGEVRFTDSGALDLQTVKSVTTDQLAAERITGFTPGTSLFIEVLGSRTGARFVATTANLVDSVTLIEAIRASIPAQSADFFELSNARVGAQPEQPEPWTEREQLVAYDYFQASGLDLPISLAELNFEDYTSWIEISGSAAGYVPGSIVFLTLTSTPLVVAEGVVDRNGEIQISGNIPVQFLEPGEHRVRLVGIRSIGGVSVDEQGEIQLSPETMAEIERFDLGTQATVRMGGTTPEGDYLNAIRVVPLNPVAPWWTLWFILAGFLIAFTARRRHWTNTRAKVIGAAALNLGAAIPAVVIGWLSTVTLVTWVGLALGLIAAAVTLLIQPSEKVTDR